MGIFDKSKLRGPTPKEQAHWDALANAEKDRQRKERKAKAGGYDAAKRSLLDRFR